MFYFQNSRVSTLQSERDFTKGGSRPLEPTWSGGRFGRSHFRQRQEEGGNQERRKRSRKLIQGDFVEDQT